MDRFKGIETFVIAAKAGSFAAVAKHLRISRAMVSRRLLELEEHLGVRLLHRTTRKLVLTSAGRHYLEVCGHVMQQLEDEERTLGSLQTEAKGLLRIASVRSFGQQHMSAAVGAFSMLYPDIQIEMELAPGTRTPLTLTEFGFDLGIAIMRSRQSDAVMHKIANFDWVMCASPSYLSENGAPRLPADLTIHRCLVNPRHAPKATWTLNVAGEEAEHPVKNALSITSSLGLREATLLGAGIARLPSFSVIDDLREGRLVAVLEDCVPIRDSICAIYPHFNLIPNKVKVLTRFLEERFRKIFELPVPQQAQARGNAKSKRTLSLAQ